MLYNAFMPIGIENLGIVHRLDADNVRALLLGKNGQSPRRMSIPEEIANSWCLNSGDIITADMKPDDTELSDFIVTAIHKVNGLELTAALQRPNPRPRRQASERLVPFKALVATQNPEDIIGRTIDYLAPLGLGDAGIISGPHGAGLTVTLRSLLAAITQNRPEVSIIVLLSRARSEEATDWRRRLPGADVIVCPSDFTGATTEESLLTPQLILDCARRQTELGRDVLLAIDSLTGIWAAELEATESDSQREADRSQARLDIRDWLQSAGDFHGEGLLGSGLGGSLTIISTVWSADFELEAEDEGELHPMLRLLEHIAQDTTWKIALSGELAGKRLYPAIVGSACYSRHEASLIGEEQTALRGAIRSELIDKSNIEAWHRVMEIIEGGETAATLAAPVISEKEKRSKWDALLPF